MIWCEPRVIITINKVVTGRFAPGKTDNITNGYAKIQKIIQKDCRNAENPHCIFRIFAVTARAPAGTASRSRLQAAAGLSVTARAPAGDSKPFLALILSCISVTTRAPAGDSNVPCYLRSFHHRSNNSRPCGGTATITLCANNIAIISNNSRPCGGQQKTDLSILTDRFYFFAQTVKNPVPPTDNIV